MKRIIICILTLILISGCQNSQHQHKYVNDDYCSCGELNPEHTHKYSNFKCACGEKAVISKNHTEALANAEYYFGTIDIGEVIDNLVVEKIDNDIVIFEVKNQDVSRYDLTHNTYSLFDYGVSLEIETLNESIIKPKWVQTKERVYKYDESDPTKVIGIEYQDVDKYILEVNPNSTYNVVGVKFNIKAPYFVGDTDTVEYAVYQKTYNMVIQSNAEDVVKMSIEKLLQYSVIEKDKLLNGNAPYVEVSGIVTEQTFGDGYEAHSFVMTDNEGNSIYVSGPNDKVNIGDEVVVIGKPVIFLDHVRINMFSNVKIISSGNNVLEPETTTIDEWYTEFSDATDIHTISGKRIKVVGTLTKLVQNGNHYLIKSNNSDYKFRIYEQSYSPYEEELLNQYVGCTCEFTVSVIYLQKGYWNVIINNFEYQPIKK